MQNSGSGGSHREVDDQSEDASHERRSAIRAREALRASQLYYLQHLTMEAIAREMKVSRSSVSRLLSYAREHGLVNIIVHSPTEARSKFEEQLTERFGVVAHVVSVPARASEAERLQRTARAAAAALVASVRSNLTIGIAWGAAVSEVVRHLPSRPTHDVRVVQMNGAINLRTTGLAYAGDLLDRFRVAFGATLHEFPVPAIFDDPATKQAMWRERSIRGVLDMQARVGLFVFGLGAQSADMPSHVFTDGYLDAEALNEIAHEGVVGDCATVFYRQDGRDAGIALNPRSSGPSLETIRRIPHRLCVVSGRSKRDSLVEALSAGVITELVVDESLARAVLRTSG